MTDRELLEKILSNQVETNTQLNNINHRLRALETNFNTLESKVNNLETKIDKVSELLLSLESLNANRHVEIITKIDVLSKDLTVVEAVAGKNMVDIANLKLVK